MIPRKYTWPIITGAVIFTAMIFSLGVWYGEKQANFRYHEIPLRSGGIALVVPDGWQVVTEWDKHGRPYIKTDGEG
jgi:hypothetical protein